ncbi:hypothetical protein [Escherichia coli]|uniref:hypothetical protein n=1 Tax=Escherichia coli TaxID=562 RepID=UPI0020752927|nr:hypothetical protein [Escherichia coli]
MLYRVAAFLHDPASYMTGKHKRGLQYGETFTHAVDLLAVTLRYQVAPPFAAFPYRVLCLLLVACQPFNPLTTRRPVICCPGIL